jgi:hypothetical protein
LEPRRTVAHTSRQGEAPSCGGSIENSTIIDLDGEVTQQDKTVYGDVELPIPGDAKPVPPPQG